MVRFSSLSSAKRALVLASLLLMVTGVGLAADRGLLWSAIQLCQANYQVTGAAFPCLEIEAQSGIARGTVTIRAPLARTHIVVSPLARVSGIEDPALQLPDAPNYLQKAWAARHYVIEAAERPIGDADIGLAVNSLPGRSQDQLHIHVDCLFQRYARELRDRSAGISAEQWTHLSFPLRGRHYWAIEIPGRDLSQTNLFKIAATLLRISPGRMENMTLVVVPKTTQGFYLLADQYTPGALGRAHDRAHGEFLLDHSCSKT